jgi:hypothetical protein
MSDEQEFYPRGRLATGAGDLLNITNVKLDSSNGAKQIHTIRRKGAGITLGVEEHKLSFDLVVGEQGEERDWYEQMKQGRIKQCRIKVPGRTITINGTVSAIGLELPLDDAIKQAISVVGHMDD